MEIPPSIREIDTSYEVCFYGCGNIRKLVFLGDEDALDLKFSSSWGKFSPFSDLKLDELYLGRVIKGGRDITSYPGLGNLKKITFGKYLNEVGTGVYHSLETIPTTAEIYCENPIPPVISNNHKFTNQQYISNVVYVPKEALEAYKQADGWKNFWDIRAYDFESGIEDASADDVSADVFKVYNLAGMLVKETADKTEAYDLPSGIYIINGRKVAIR